MSSRIQTAFPKDEPMPANIFPDLNWISDNRPALFKKYGSCVILVYQQEVIGIGKTRNEAMQDAESHLALDTKQITPAIGYISNPYRVGLFQRKESQD